MGKNNELVNCFLSVDLMPVRRASKVIIMETKIKHSSAQTKGSILQQN